MLERVERVGVGDVVDEQEGVGFQVAGGPEAAVFFLAGGVGQGEVVGEAVDDAGDGVGIFCGVGQSWCGGVVGRREGRRTYCWVVSGDGIVS